MQRVTARVEHDKEVITPGVNWESKLTEIHRVGVYRVWHHTAGTHVTGNYQPRAYHAAQLTLWRCVETHQTPNMRGKEQIGTHTYETLELIQEMEPGTKWRQAQRQMKEQATRLATADDRAAWEGATKHDLGGATAGPVQVAGGAGPLDGLLGSGGEDRPQSTGDHGDREGDGDGAETGSGPVSSGGSGPGSGYSGGDREVSAEPGVLSPQATPRPPLRRRLSVTHTYVLLEISAHAWEEIAALLRAADYDHVFTEPDVIDMHGIALQRVLKSII